ncbi:MAG: DUF192 domain-containing protein [Leeuwenhoekiella sp.]
MCLFSLLISSCKDKKESAEIKRAEVAFTKEGELQILRNDSVLKTLDIEIADNEYETQTGLMYRSQMAENQGMLFIFDKAEAHSFYMKNTQIPLDIIYIRADSTVAKIIKNAEPYNERSIPSGEPVKFVLEVNAGKATDWNVTSGDRVHW